MNKTCLNCIHKDVCIERSTAVFMLYIQTGRYDQIEEGKGKLNLHTNDCKNWGGES